MPRLYTMCPWGRARGILPPGSSVVFRILFDWRLEVGRCVGLHESGAPVPDLSPGCGADILDMDSTSIGNNVDLVAVNNLPVSRRRTFIAGRAALRLALQRENVLGASIGRSERGAPTLPRGWAGSISHTEVLSSNHRGQASDWLRGDVVAVALVGRELGAHLGVDVELDRRPSIDIASHVLSDDELPDVAVLEPSVRASEIMLRFSAKEALYKAIDPFVRRYVSFKEVSVTPQPDGTADVNWHLEPDRGEGAFATTLRWRRTMALIVTMARVEMKPR